MKWGTTLLAAICLKCATAQTTVKKQIDASTLADEVFAMQDLNINYQDLYENFLQLLSNPLDLNTATDEQLNSLYILSPKQIQAFITFRKEIGKFISEYELQSIPGFTPDICEKLAPFVTVNVNSNIRSFSKTLFSKGNSYFVTRISQTLEEQKGYASTTDSSSRYVGSPVGLYARFRTTKTNEYSTGFTLKKDAGEKFNWNPQLKSYGFDYVSFHAQLQNKGRLKNLIVGDFQSQFGQGIALGSVFGIGKNGEAVTTIRRANVGFSPYTSQYEAGYFRGIAVSYQLHQNVSLHAMASARARDASSPNDSIQNSIDVVSSFGYSGLHRTATEIANRARVMENNAAIVINYKNQSVDAGLLMHATEFGATLVRSPTAYNQFAFSGNANKNIGGFINYSYRNVSIFSEWTHTMGNGSAVAAGLLTSLTNKIDVSFLYRNFNKNFFSFYSNAIAENSVAQNEIGFYWGWKYTFNKQCSFTGYADIFQFPWLKYRSYSPSTGSEWLMRFNYKPSKSVSAFIQMREETKQRNTSTDNNLYLTSAATRRNYWLNIDYAATQQLSLKSRIQISTFEIERNVTSGIVLLQDVSYSRQRWTLSGRYAIFDTENYDNRLYVYERDVWLAFTFPAYSGKGTRQYLLLQYQFSRNIDIWLRWSQTRYLNQDTIGSGGETITGNTDNDVKFQIRWLF
jgi:hypothetical protein